MSSNPTNSSTGVWGPDSSGAPDYIAGNPWGICDRCGNKRRRRGFDALRKEWTGLWVCAPCFDPKPPEMSPPQLWPEGVPIPDAKPEPPPIYVDVPSPYS